MGDLRRLGPVHLRREALVCRNADAQVLVRDSVAESVLLRPARYLAPRLVVVLAADHVLARTVVHARKLMAAYLSLLQLDHLPHLAREIAHRVCRGLSPARTARAKHPHVVQLSAALRRHDLDRPVCLLQRAEAKCVPHLRRALQFPRDEDVLRPCPFHVQTVPAICLTSPARSHLALHVHVCRAPRAVLRDHQRRLLDFPRYQAAGCLLHVRRHALAAECSSDFQS